MRIIRIYKWLRIEKIKRQNGFTLIELMVAISVFAIVMLISTGSILSVFDANRKSQTLRTVMDNLNFTMEGMTRAIRFGTSYHCNKNITPIASPLDCASGADSLVFKDANNAQVVYKFDQVSGRIARSVNGGPDYFVTSPDITINRLTFRVFGSLPYSNSPHDLFQPQVIIVINGLAGAKASSQSAFNLETTVSQRLFDSQ